MFAVYLWNYFYMDNSLSMLTLKAAASATTCKAHIVGIITMLISNEQLWEFRYSLGNPKLIIWSKNDLKLAYGIYKRIITINPLITHLDYHL